MGPLMTGNPLSEDCLRLSVFTPGRDGRRPVMVWICGGAFVTGSGEFARYDASRLCEDGDIVVVNISYRVGAFGFLYQPEEGSTNLGLEDQICALEWVRKHISSFGGDPDRITVCGQSAGAYSIANLIARGRTDLFSKAILFSAPFSLSSSPAAGKRMRKLFQRSLARIAGRSASVRTASIDQMLAAQEKMLKSAMHPLPFCPVGEKVYPDRPVEGLTKVLLTCQKDDAQPFAPIRPLVGPVTDFIFRKPMYRYAGCLRRSGIEVQTEEYDWHPAGNPIGACHTLEIPFLFGTWDSWNKAAMLQGTTEEEFESRASGFRKKISDFVKG